MHVFLNESMKYSNIHRHANSPYQAFSRHFDPVYLHNHNNSGLKTFILQGKDYKKKPLAHGEATICLRQV